MRQTGLTPRARLWLGGVLAALALATAGAGIATPFLMEGPTAAVAGVTVGLVVAAEILALLALLLLGRDLYAKLRELLAREKSSPGAG